MEKTLRIGVMPGRINEYVLGEGTTVGEALEIAGLDASGFDIKVDGVKKDLDFVIGEDNNLILLAKQVKGNK